MEAYSYLSLCEESMLHLVRSDPSADRPEWRPYVFSRHPLAVAYRYSAGGYSFAGLLLLLFADRMRSYDAGVWWCALGMALVVQGAVAYLGDVQSWGRPSVWKQLDPLLASTLFLAFGPWLGARSLLGHFVVPRSTLSLWLAGCALALFAKAKAAQASRRAAPRLEEMLAWHTLWHALPFLAVFCILDLAFMLTFAGSEFARA